MPWTDWITPAPGIWDNPGAATFGKTSIQMSDWSFHRETNPTGRPTMTFPAPNWAPAIADAQAAWAVGAGSTESCQIDGSSWAVTETVTFLHRYFMGASYNIIGPDTSTHTDTQVRLQRATVWGKVNPGFAAARVTDPYDHGLPPSVVYTDLESEPGVDATFIGWTGTVTVSAEAGSDTEPNPPVVWSARVYVDAGQTLTCDSLSDIGSTSPPDTGEAYFDTLGGTSGSVPGVLSALDGVQEFTLGFQPAVPPTSGLLSAPPTSGGNKMDWSANATMGVTLYPLIQLPRFRVFVEEVPEPVPPVLPPTFQKSAGADSLECGEYHFYVMDRGGLRRYFELLPVERWQWDRVRDGISTATLFVSTSSVDCCASMENMECGRHELAIERNGIRVWEGPITRLGYGRDNVEIEAHDVMHYPYKAIMKSAYNNAYPNIITAVQRVKNILNTELARFEALTPSINVLPHMVIYSTTGTAKTSRSTKPYERMAWEEIDEMAARGGIDYTVIGRKILVFDVDDVIGRTRPMTENDFLDEIIVTQYGMELATYSAVTDGDGHWGAIGKTDPYYGIWEILETAFGQADSAHTNSAPTVAEMSEQAKRNGFGRSPAPTVVRVPDGATLRDDTGILLSSLVPGVRIPLNATQTCRKVSQEQKLDRMVCNGEPGNETFRITLSPAPGTSIWTDADKEDSG